VDAVKFFNLLKQRIARPLNLVDVGAAGGALDVWRQFGDAANIFCFEAREGEADYLTRGNSENNIEYVPVALSSNNKGLDLHLADNLGCSSAYPPAAEVCRRHLACGQHREMRTIRCPSITLDEFVAKRGIDEIHAIKLDTQGSELDILKGAEIALKHCQLVIAEAEFNELYSGQNLFCDLDRYLRDHGFVLWRFNNLAHYSTGQIGSDEHVMHIGSAPGSHQLIHFPNGQLFWADALYVRREATAAATGPMSEPAALAGAALVSQWRFFDLAIEMVRKSGDHALVDQLYDALGEKFAPLPAGRIPPGRFASLICPVREDRIESDFSHADGCIVYGPYLPLPYGAMEAVFHVEASGVTPEKFTTPLRFDVAQNEMAIASVDLIGAEGAEALRSGAVRVPFFNNSPREKFEFRIEQRGGRPFEGRLTFLGATVRRADAH
jgi:FkbM family methyltransferase